MEDPVFVYGGVTIKTEEDRMEYNSKMSNEEWCLLGCYAV
jgi:hypothetical protein